MDKPLTDAELDALALAHAASQHGYCCMECGADWPCVVSELAEELRALRAEAEDCHCGRSMVHQACRNEEKRLREQNAMWERVALNLLDIFNATCIALNGVPAPELGDWTPAMLPEKAAALREQIANLQQTGANLVAIVEAENDELREQNAALAEQVIQARAGEQVYVDLKEQYAKLVAALERWETRHKRNSPIDCDECDNLHHALASVKGEGAHGFTAAETGARLN